MDSFEHHGVWWDPRDPSQQWVGTLCFDSRTGATLTVTLPAERPNPFPSMNTYDLILGLTTASIAVSLTRCFERSTQGTFGRAPRSIEIFANSVIVGFHCDSPDPLVSAASATFQHLADWWGHSGLEPDLMVEARDRVVRYKAPPPLVVHDDELWRISLRAVVTGPMERHRITLQEEVRFEVKASTPTPLSAFRQRMQACGDFLSVGCLTYCGIEEFVIVPPTAPGGRAERGTFHAMPIYESRERRASVTGHTLLQFSDIEARAPAVLGAWFSQADKLHDVRALYLAGGYGQGFLEGKLLALTQAAEAFHRRFYPGLYMDAAEFATSVFEPLKAAIPKLVSEDHRAAIMSRLRFANDFSQSRRLAALFAEHAEALRVLIDEPKTWVRPIIEHRNAFTHFDPSFEPAHGPDRVLLYNWVLRLLLEVCFLKAMGLTADEIPALVRRSDTYRQVALRFFERQVSS